MNYRLFYVPADDCAGQKAGHYGKDEKKYGDDVPCVCVGGIDDGMQ